LAIKIVEQSLDAEIFCHLSKHGSGGLDMNILWSQGIEEAVIKVCNKEKAR
jgi:hypothetical protein